jgi:alkyl sulfatase BDS1-like metallo-beta-lactamase superfamily hydrolase
VPGSEAPAEFTFYLPDHKAFCGAEVVSQTMHNLYTLRGAKVRDALAWSNYLDEAIRLFPDTEVYFGTHHWPVWGKQRVIEFLEGQRDLYKYIHDQTLRLANSGLTPREIAEELVLPESLDRQFSSRGYYGSLKHNSKAVYQFYFGWYDGNPANLDPLPPEAAGIRYVELAGGAAQLMIRAQKSFDRGDYRWTAELLNHLVFARPEYGPAKRLLSKTYRQLAYQAESTQWRNSYLVAALELESGVQSGPGLMERASQSMLLNIPVEAFFDVMAVRLNGPKAANEHIVFNVTFSDLDKSYVLEIKNGVLHNRQRDPSPTATATLVITHEMFVKILLGKAGLRDALFSDEVNLEGSKLGAVRFFRLFEQARGNFNIVTP